MQYLKEKRLLKQKIVSVYLPIFLQIYLFLDFKTGVKMSMRGRFFTRAEYQQFVYYALVDVRGKIKTLPPCIIKPSALWSGKQIISTIIINLVPEVSCPLEIFLGNCVIMIYTHSRYQSSVLCVRRIRKLKHMMVCFTVQKT